MGRVGVAVITPGEFKEPRFEIETLTISFSYSEMDM